MSRPAKVWTFQTRQISDETISRLRARNHEAGDLQSYASYYGFEDVPQLESVEVEEFDIAVLRLRHSELKFVALVVHGYMSHAGQFSEIANALHRAGGEIVLVDLPGHGLSSGKRNSIGDFATYGRVINALKPFCGAGLPLHIVAHSTGCSAVVEALLQANTLGPKSIAFAAPLVWVPMQAIKSFGNAFLPFAIKLPRLSNVPRGIIRNQVYADFSQFRDPLYANDYDPRWLRAQARWARNLGKQTKTLNFPLLMCQGTRDIVVNYRRNLPLLSDLFEGARIELFEGLSHTLLQELPTDYRQVEETILHFLRLDLKAF